MALGHLVMSCCNLVFIDLIEHLLAELGRNDNMSTTRTYIQCTAAISRQAGHRIGTASTCPDTPALYTRGVRYQRNRKYIGGNLRYGMNFDVTARPVGPVDSVVCNALQSR